MSERKLVTIRTVKEVHPIPGADRIEQLIVDGWSLVSGKGNFKAGQYCVFFEPDSFVDVTKPQFQFLEKNKITWNGKEGARIKTQKIRKCLSQGLALPLTDFGVIEEIDGKEYLRINKECNVTRVDENDNIQNNEFD